MTPEHPQLSQHSSLCFTTFLEYFNSKASIISLFLLTSSLVLLNHSLPNIQGYVMIHVSSSLRPLVAYQSPKPSHLKSILSPSYNLRYTSAVHLNAIQIDKDFGISTPKVGFLPSFSIILLHIGGQIISASFVVFNSNLVN